MDKNFPPDVGLENKFELKATVRADVTLGLYDGKAAIKKFKSTGMSFLPSRIVLQSINMLTLAHHHHHHYYFSYMTFACG